MTRRLTPEQRLLRSIREDSWQRKVTDYAELRGWWWYHARPAWTRKGWRTAQAGMRGFPDLVLTKVGRVLLVELKRETEKLELEQVEWQRRLEPTGLYRVWRPSDWNEVMRELATP